MVLISPLLEELGISPEPDQSQHGHTEDRADSLPDPLVGLIHLGPHHLGLGEEPKLP